jgi:hypothetical protein
MRSCRTLFFKLLTKFVQFFQQHAQMVDTDVIHDTGGDVVQVVSPQSLQCYLN